MANTEKVVDICQQLNVTLRRAQRMSNHTAIGVGGLIDSIAYPEFGESAAELIAQLEAEQIRWLPLGSGSRLIVTDEPIDAVAINLKLLEELLTFNDTRVRAHGGYRMARLIEATVDRGLSGLEAFTGRNGTLAAAIRNRDRSRGKEIISLVEKITIIRNGRLIELTQADLKSYQGELIIGAVLQLSQHDGAELKARVARYSRNIRQQPMHATGPVFCNVKGRSPAGIIKRLGLNGYRCGGVAIDEKDANLIVNDGTATTKDLLMVVETVRERVAAETGIKLRSALEIWQ